VAEALPSQLVVQTTASALREKIKLAAALELVVGSGVQSCWRGTRLPDGSAEARPHAAAGTD
jgi:hypothetical protein